MAVIDNPRYVDRSDACDCDEAGIVRHEALMERSAIGRNALFLGFQLANFFAQQMDVGENAHGIASNESGVPGAFIIQGPPAQLDPAFPR
jgi:hypothetical protein